MDNQFKVWLLLKLFMLWVLGSNALCVSHKSGIINETRPSAANDWCDVEQWNSSVVDAFCPISEGGAPGIECIDDKGEAIGSSRNTPQFSAFCTVDNGLNCTRNNQTLQSQCTDFYVIYSCTCPSTSTGTQTTTHKISTSTNRTQTALSTERALTTGRALTADTAGQLGVTSIPFKSEAGLSSGTIAGIADGGVTLVGLFIAGLLIYKKLRMDKRQTKVKPLV